MLHVRSGAEYFLDGGADAVYLGLKELSARAKANLDAAVSFVLSFIKEGSLHFLK